MPSATPLTARRTPSLLKNTIVFLPEATAALAMTMATVARSGSSVERVRLMPKLLSIDCYCPFFRRNCLPEELGNVFTKVLQVMRHQPAMSEGAAGTYA